MLKSLCCRSQEIHENPADERKRTKAKEFCIQLYPNLSGTIADLAGAGRAGPGHIPLGHRRLALGPLPPLVIRVTPVIPDQVFALLRDACLAEARSGKGRCWVTFRLPSEATAGQAARKSNGSKIWKLRLGPGDEIAAGAFGESPQLVLRLNEGLFIAPVATNSGSLGVSASGAYRGRAINSIEAP